MNGELGIGEHPSFAWQSAQFPIRFSLGNRAVFFPGRLFIFLFFFFSFFFFFFHKTQDHQLKSTPVLRLHFCSGVSDVCVEIKLRI